MEKAIKADKYFQKFAVWVDGGLILASLFTFSYWLTGQGLFYSESSPVMSPLTSFSLLLMASSRLAEKLIETWSKPMTLAILGMVSCGNLSSLWIQLLSPELFLNSMPNIVPTSAMTSLGIILFCFYEILVVIRKTPETAFIVDDILLHLALFPGGLSFLGHVLGVQAYMSSGLDPRVGIGYMEMVFMALYAIVAVVSNPNLFLWRFLANNKLNRMTFLIFFINQFVAPILVGFNFRHPDLPGSQLGIEFYVMVAGVLSTLIFLIIHALYNSRDESLI